MGHPFFQERSFVLAIFPLVIFCILNFYICILNFYKRIFRFTPAVCKECTVPRIFWFTQAATEVCGLYPFSRKDLRSACFPFLSFCFLHFPIRKSDILYTFDFVCRKFNELPVWSLKIWFVCLIQKTAILCTQRFWSHIVWHRPKRKTGRWIMALLTVASSTSSRFRARLLFWQGTDMGQVLRCTLYAEVLKPYRVTPSKTEDRPKMCYTG